MAARTVKMRHISIAVISAWLVSCAAAIATRNVHTYGIFHAISFVIGWATSSRISFTHVPLNRLWIVLGLPLALAVYAVSGEFLGFGTTVSWALIALSFIAGGRAANLVQMLQQRS
jgi:hypothetical protein